MTADERLRRYAELTVRVGANVQPGQDAVVACLVEHAEIARAVTREAYRAGASHVIVLYGDLHLRRAAIELGPEEALGWSAPYLLYLYERWGEEHPALIVLTGNPDPGLLSDLDPALVGRSEPKELRAAGLRHIEARNINWTIVSYATPAWAKAVFPNDTEEVAVNRLWDAIFATSRR